MLEFTPRRENLYRGLTEQPGRRDEHRSGGGDTPVLFGHLAVLNRFTNIESWYEGTFRERIAPGAFTKTIDENLRNVKVQFDHGHDPFVGNSPLGHIDTLREDDFGIFYEVDLLDTDYNRDRVLPMLEGRTMSGEKRGSLLGASFRFSVVKERWDDTPERSDDNPDGIPERTITELKLHEFGPVVFPAYVDASAGARSLTDHYLDLQRAERGAEGQTISQPSAGLVVTEQAIPQEPANEGHSGDANTQTGRSLVELSALTHKVARRP